MFDNLEIISSSSSARIKRARALYSKKQRLLQSIAVVESQNPVEVLIQKNPELIVELFIDEKLTNYQNITSKWDERTYNIFESAQKNPEIKLHKVQRKVLDDLSVDAQGILALAKTKCVSSPTKSRQIVICKEISDPGNAGAILRASAALGASKVIFAGDSVDHWNPKVVRASVGAVFQIAVESAKNVNDAIKFAQSSGFKVFAADGFGTPSKPAQNLQSALKKINKDTQIAWLFGNEAHGLEDADLELVDEIVKIEMNSDVVESLNLAGAVHICLYSTNSAFDSVL